MTSKAKKKSQVKERNGVKEEEEGVGCNYVSLQWQV